MQVRTGHVMSVSAHVSHTVMKRFYHLSCMATCMQHVWMTGDTYIQVNFRGSTGYGKTFLHKGDKQWGVGTMQHDLTDAVQWAIDQSIADPKRVAIYGGSYGTQLR